MGAGVSVCLDAAAKLLIDKGASAKLKELARAHKEELMDVCRAQEIMNRPGMRCILCRWGISPWLTP